MQAMYLGGAALLERRGSERSADRDTAPEVVAAFESRQVPCAAIAGTGQAVNSDQVAERGLLREVQHPFWGVSRVPTQPVRCASVAPNEVRAAPALGADSETVLQQWLDFDRSAIDQLRANHII